MTAFEELFQMTTKLGLSTISKKAPHGKWRIAISMPNGATISGARNGTGVCELSLCEIDADTPDQAATLAVTQLKKRLEEIGESYKERMGTK
ncbi:MAG: hypothetical protein IKE02_06900 [Lachnospiraceae bacterium]|nr:hypothetical protein [Lachnospiraceae bacterium]